MSSLDSHGEQIERLWTRVEELSPGTRNRLALGQAFQELRSLYSERNSGGHRLTSGHGSFETEIRKRSKYSARAVRDMIADFESNLRGEPSTSAKRKARRRVKISSASDPVSEFARLLPFQVAQAAYRAAAKMYHPDRGGNNCKMQALNVAWERAKAYYAPCYSVVDGTFHKVNE
jgi:hypothetical protein